ncbi:MAG: hypothetical protein EXX96DRAFT_545848 [Benjaminiella poitrasii]|nr:MAG: hypothetical protein EXX96DRAFT_545848 [Benjaminiella poitrasii]
MELNKETIEALKKRIIATNTLLHSLSTANDELARNKTTITNLNNDLLSATQQSRANELKCEEALKELEGWKKRAEELERAPDEKEQIEQLKAAVDAKSRALHIKTAYINQLEKKLAGGQKGQEDVSSGKQDVGMKKKNEELSALNKRLVTLSNELTAIKSELNETKAAKEQLEEDIMEININNDMTVQSQQEEIDELKQKLQETASVELKAQLDDKLAEIDQLKKSIRLMNDDKSAEIDRLKKSILVMNDDKSAEIDHLKKSIRLMNDDMKKSDASHRQAVDRYINEIAQLKLRVGAENTLHDENSLLKNQLQQAETELKSVTSLLQQAQAEAATAHQQLEAVKQECVLLKSRASSSPARKSPSVTRALRSPSSSAISADIANRLSMLKGEANFYKRETYHLRSELKKVHVELEAIKLRTDASSPSSSYYSAISSAPLDNDSLLVSSPLDATTESFFPNLSTANDTLDTQAANVSDSSAIQDTSSVVSIPQQMNLPAAIDSSSFSGMTDTAEASVAASSPIANDSVTKASSYAVPATVIPPASETLKKPVRHTRRTKTDASSSAGSLDLSPTLPSSPSTSDSMSSIISPSDQSPLSDASTDFLGTNPVPSTLSPSDLSPSEPSSTQPSTTTAAAAGRKPAKVSKRKESRLSKFVNAKDPAKFLSKGKDVPAKKGTQGRKSVKRDSSHFSEMIITAQENLRKRQRAESPVLHDFQHQYLNKGELPPSTFFDGKASDILRELELQETKFSSGLFFDQPEFEQYGVQDVLTVNVFTGMSSYEKLFALLLTRMGLVNPEQYTTFMELLTNIITRHTSKEIFDKMILHYIRLATIVIHTVNNDTELIRMMIMEVYNSKSPRTNVIAALTNVGYLWPDAFMMQHDKATSPFSLWEEAFQASIILAVKKYRIEPQVLNLYEKVVNLFGWKSMPPTVSEIIDRSLKLLSGQEVVQLHGLNKGMSFEHLKYNLVRALEIAFVSLDNWQETYDVFIRTKLWPLLNGKATSVICIELLGVLGSLGLSKDQNKKDEPGVLVLVTTLVQILEMGDVVDEESKNIQFAACKALLTIAGNSKQKHVEYAKPAIEFINNL